MHNVSPSGRVAITHTLHMLALLFENFIFVYLGISLFAYSSKATVQSGQCKASGHWLVVSGISLCARSRSWSCMAPAKRAHHPATLPLMRLLFRGTCEPPPPGTGRRVCSQFEGIRVQ